MANTLQEAFKLAKEKGLSTRDAIAQVEGNTGTQTTPTPTGGATLPIAPQVQPTPLPATPPPTSPVPPIPVTPPQQTQPLPPAPTSMPKQVKPTEQPIDFNQGLGREQDINNNLNTFYSQGITTPDEIKKASGYDTADQNKKNIVDAFITAKQPSSDALYSSIATKQVIPESVKLTPAYKQAQNRFNRVNMYSSMTPSQVSTAMDNGQIIEGSQTWEDLKMQNPKLAQDVQNLRIVNGSRTNLYTVNPDGTKTNNLQKTYEEQFMEDFSDLFKVSSVADIINQVKTQDVLDAEAKANKYEDEMNALEADIAKIDKDVEAELKGSGATGSRARLEKSVRRDKLNNDLQALNKLYTTQANRANQLITQNATALQTQQQQQSARNQALAGVMMKGYENQMALKQKQAEFEQGLAQQAQLAKDPTTAIGGILDQFSKLGITADKDLASHIATFEASGMTLPEYTAKMIQDFKAKPEYQKIQSLQMGQLSDVQKAQLGFNQDMQRMAVANQYDLTKMGINNQQDIQKLMLNYNLGNQKDLQSSKIDLMGKGYTPDQADAIVRSATGNWKGATGESLLTAPDGTIIPSRLSETTNKNGGKECGEYVNDITGAGLGSTWASKQAKIDTSITVPEVGNTAVWIPDPSNKQFAQYGHAGVITAVNGNNVTIKSSNLNGQGEISTITVPISEITKTGGFVNTAIKGPGKTSGLAKEDIKNINGLYDDLKSIDTFKNWKAISSQVTWFNDLKNKELNGSDIQGLITNYAKVLDPTSVVRESEFAMAQKGASQGAIDRAKTSIATYLNGGSAVLSKDAQEALKSAMSRRFDAVKEAYVNEVDSQVARGKQMGMPVTWENLTGESRDSYTKSQSKTTQQPLSLDSALSDALSFLNNR